MIECGTFHGVFFLPIRSLSTNQVQMNTMSMIIQFYYQRNIISPDTSYSKNEDRFMDPDYCYNNEKDFQDLRSRAGRIIVM